MVVLESYGWSQHSTGFCPIGFLVERARNTRTFLFQEHGYEVEILQSRGPGACEARGADCLKKRTRRRTPHSGLYSVRDLISMGFQSSHPLPPPGSRRSV